VALQVRWPVGTLDLHESGKEHPHRHHASDRQR
jgi:hypothetical protein